MLLAFTALIVASTPEEAGLHLVPRSGLLLAQEIGREIPPLPESPAKTAPDPYDPSNWDRHAGASHPLEMLAAAGGIIVVGAAEVPLLLFFLANPAPGVVAAGVLGTLGGNLLIIPLVATLLAKVIDTGFYKAGTFGKAFLYSFLTNLVGTLLSGALLAAGSLYGIIAYLAGAWGASYGWHSGNAFKNPPVQPQPTQSGPIPTVWVPALSVQWG